VSGIPMGPQEPGKKILEGTDADCALIFTVAMSRMDEVIRAAPAGMWEGTLIGILDAARAKVKAVLAGETYDLGEWEG